MENYIIYILKINLLSAICILMVILVSRWLNRRYSSHWRYIMWLLLAIFLLVPINLFTDSAVIRLEIPNRDNTASINSSSQRNSIDKAEGFQPIIDTSTNPQERAEKGTELPISKTTSKSHVSFDLLAAFSYTWLIGVVGISIWKIVTYKYSLARLHRWGVPQKNRDIISIYRMVCRNKGIKHPPLLMSNSELESPLLAGLTTTYLYLPDISYTDEELRLIFSHELSHYKHMDLWYKMLLLIVNTIYWFNPMLYIMAKEAEKDLEYICDTSVVVKCSHADRMIYGELLLKTAVTHSFQHYLSASLNDGTAKFKERILHMMKRKSLKKGLLPVIILTSFLLLSNALVGCSFQKKTTDSESKVTSSSSNIKKEEDVPKVTPEEIKPTVSPTPTVSSSDNNEPTKTPQETGTDKAEPGKTVPGKTEKETDDSKEEGVTAKIQVYEGLYYDEATYRDVNREGYSSNYCEVIVSNVTDTSFDFTIYDCDYNADEREVIFNTNTAIFVGDGMEAVFYGNDYTLNFTFPNGHNSYPAATEMMVSGFESVEGHTFLNNAIPGHEFG